MPRYDRARFLAFGLLSTVNVVALLIHGLGLATHGRGGAAASLPWLVVLAGLWLLLALHAAVRRGRDLDWPALQTIATFAVALAFGPALLVLIAFLSLAKTGTAPNRFGPPAPRPSIATWLAALLLQGLPWGLLAVAARLLA